MKGINWEAILLGVVAVALAVVACVLGSSDNPEVARHVPTAINGIVAIVGYGAGVVRTSSSSRSSRTGTIGGGALALLLGAGAGELVHVLGG